MASIIKVDQIQESTTGVGTNFSTTGSATTPTISLGNQTNKGFYHAGSDKIGVSIGGSKVGEIGVGYGGFTGNVIQVVQTNITSVFSTQLDTLQNVTNFNCSITPRYNSSKILILSTSHVAVDASSESSGRYHEIALLRSSTKISTITNASRAIPGGGSNNIGWTFVATFNFLDSPSTTSSITYQIQARVISAPNVYRVTVGLDNSNSNLTLIEVQQ